MYASLRECVEGNMIGMQCASFSRADSSKVSGD